MTDQQEREALSLQVLYGIALQHPGAAEREAATRHMQVLHDGIAARATIPQGMRWTPVAEKLPAEMTHVLCAYEFDGPGDWRIKVGGWQRMEDGIEWRVIGASWTPTHWMPLPVPPSAAMLAAAPQQPTE